MGSTTDTTWARKKLARARALLSELDRACEAWVDPVAHELRLVVTDEGHIQARLAFPEHPPLDDWALIVGDCVHNMRTALDVFVWANSTNLRPDERRKVSYPILNQLEDEDTVEPLPHRLENQTPSTQAWVRPKVAGLPEPLRTKVIGSMRRAQAFTEDGHVYWHQSFPLIRELDDIDKHRLALDLETSSATVTWDVVARDAAGRRVEFDLDWTGSKRRSRDGDDRLIVTGIPRQPISGFRGRASMSLILRVSVLNLSLQIRDSLDGFVNNLENSLDAFER